ncbi:hypothetical protein M433DRAFT_150370 [Acidomyces richmondensis BFW]|nr:MAG: hypothetical protein FE78DRAFT_94578 [Acidomyces sp. 'richmondensis']KYG49113.1 hypothetical protein M433DRAFT_150370 [Acidomyces richmondensis BFW]
MAQTGEPRRASKREATKACQREPPPAKKPRLSTEVHPSPSTLSPAVAPTSEKTFPRLPTKIVDGKPLPSLPAPQSASLPDTEYQSIKESGVLQSSLARSQTRWTLEGIFDRYWVKPETGKNANPPPPNNPDYKWMKHKGECRIRIEPHIFKCEMYVEEKPKPPPPPKQYAPPQNQNTYGQQFRPQQQPAYTPQQPYQQSRTLPPMAQQPLPQNRTLPPINNMTRTPMPARVPPLPDKKANPDPVISKLAARASTDPELKSLMKEVATGNASQEQLRVFQRHIDELQRQIKEEREAEERRAREAEAAAKLREDITQYDGANDAQPESPMPPPQQGTSQPCRPVHQHPYAPSQQPNGTVQAYQHPLPLPQQPRPWIPPPPPPRHPVILSFAIPGASDDRFLFPQNAILEPLSAHHLLASFIITCKGRDAADSTALDPEKEYWQPITLMLEVKYGLEDLPVYVKKWVNPADEVRKHMEDIMAKCERAPETYLALRLPLKGAASAAETEESGHSKEDTPVSVSHIEEKSKSKSSVKYVKKPSSATKISSNPSDSAGTTKKAESDAKKGGEEDRVVAAPSGETAEKGQNTTSGTSASPVNKLGQVPSSGPSNEKGEEKTESERPRRNLRKSVRISEGEAGR